MGLKVLTVALVVVVVAAGCGSKKSAAPTVTSTETALKTTLIPAKSCAQVIDVANKATQSMDATSNKGMASLDDIASVYRKLAAAAPAEIRPDFETLATAFSSYAKTLKKAGYTPGKTPTAAQMKAVASLATLFSSPKLAAAEQHLNAWGKKNCKGWPRG